MSDQGVDKNRRRFLTATTAVVGGAGVAAFGFAGVMFMTKSERTLALGAPSKANISRLKLGEMITIEWRSKPVWIVRRTQEMLKDLGTLETFEVLRDPKSEVAEQQPDYATNQFRSIKKEILVVIGICTHLGCSPYRIDKTAQHNLGKRWKGGFFCACHGSIFDFAGRVYKKVPAPTNLVVPAHMYDPGNPHVIIIGKDSENQGDA